MLNTNLLPKEETKNMRLERWRRAIIFLTGGIILTLLTGAVLILPSFLPMFFQKSELERFLTLEGQNSQRLGIKDDVNQVQQTQKKLLAVWSFIDSPPKASPILDIFFNLDNSLPGIALTNINVDGKGKISIDGMAKTRDDLLEFQAQLTQTGKFTSVYTPLSTLVRGTENFTMQVQLKPNFSL